MRDADAQTRALLSCAAAVAHPEQQRVLDEALRQVSDFGGFAERAEREGISPLVAAHAAAHPSLPKEQRLQLIGLATRHKLAAQARTRALEDALNALHAAGIRALCTKGAALAWLVYPSPQLRPMRDVDLLVEDATLQRTAEALTSAGFGQRHDAPPDCHEVYTIDQIVDGFPIRIDVHRRLGLFELPSYRRAARQELAALFDDATRFHIGDAVAYAPGPADLLRTVHRHGFCLGLYEQYRLISVADLVTAAERFVSELDWARMQREDPRTFGALRALGRAVPLSAALSDALALRAPKRLSSAGLHYAGFFSAGEVVRAGLFRQLQEARVFGKGERAGAFFGYEGGSFVRRLFRTVAPPRWWLLMRHGRAAFASSLLHLCDLTVVAWRRLSGSGNVRR